VQALHGEGSAGRGGLRLSALHEGSGFQSGLLINTKKSLPSGRDFFYGDFKFGFAGQGFHPCTPPRTFLKKGSWNSKNFQKTLINIIF
jgi:hypothetical protein